MLTEYNRLSLSGSLFFVDFDYNMHLLHKTLKQ